MRKAVGMALLAALALGWIWFDEPKSGETAAPPAPVETPGPKPNDWFWRQRAFPTGDIDYRAVAKAAGRARDMRRRDRAKNRVYWETVGPTNIGGRVTDVAIDGRERVFIGTAFGGVWRSDDRGESWTPVFEEQPSLAIGDIALAPSNHDVIYVGTGEANGGGNNYGGTGVYKSTDGGETWLPSGLPDSRFIGRIAVHPQNPDLVYAAAMGELYGQGGNRGLYRSQDGGFSWTRVLFASPRAGFIDVAIDPQRPERVFAVSWDREREPGGRYMGGVDSGVWRSLDGGENWARLGGGLPDPAPEVGRIGLAIAPSDPDVLYAIYADNIGFFTGVYKSQDGGATWSRTTDGALENMYANFGWYFGNIRVHPEDPDVAFALGQTLYVTEDGGASWFEYHQLMTLKGTPIPQNERVHVDHHGLDFSPADPDFVVLGNDGGAYVAQAGYRMHKRFQLPITQFYAAKIDPNFPERYYGGTQDNGTLRALSGREDGWAAILGGDGFRIEVDPRDSDNIYVEFQYGGLFQIKNGQYIDGREALDPNDRANWNAPMALDPNDPDRFYYGTNRIYATDTGVTGLTPISGDLSKGPGAGNLSFGTTTTIAVAPSDSQTIYTGLDDGGVWATSDRGETWQPIAAGLPERWVTSVAVDPRDAAIAYVTFSGYTKVDFAAHVYRTADRGQTWTDISGNLPNAPANDLVVDSVDPDILYLATDMGVFFRRGPDQPWRTLGAGLPLVSVLDLDLHPTERKLAAATFGRSMYVIDTGRATAGDDVQGSDLAHRRWLPGVGGESEALVAIVNPGDAPAAVEIYGFNALGEEIGRAQALAELPPRGGARLFMAALFPDSSANIAWLQVAADRPLHVFAELQNDETRAAYWGADALEPLLFAPHVARDTALFETRFAVVNGGPFGASQSARRGIVGRDTLMPEHLAPYTHVDRDVRDLFGVNLEAVSMASLVSNAASMAAMERFVTLPDRGQMAALGLNAASGETLRFLHVAADLTQFWTGMVYLPIGDAPVRVEERYFGASGGLLDLRVRESVAPEQKITLLVDRANAAAFPAGTAWIEVRADGPLIGYELFGSPRERPDDFFAGLKSAESGGRTLDYPYVVYAADRWTGLVAVNLGEETADIAFTAYDAAGAALETATVVDAAPKVKLVRLLEALFQNPDTWSRAAWVRAEATGSQWAGFALWGDRGGETRRHMSGLTAAVSP